MFGMKQNTVKDSRIFSLFITKQHFFRGVWAFFVDIRLTGRQWRGNAFIDTDVGSRQS